MKRPIILYCPLIPKPPFEEKSGEEVFLSLHYRVLAVWEMEAQRFVDEGAVCLYTLLPAMQGANAPLLIGAPPDSLQADYAEIESNV